MRAEFRRGPQGVPTDGGTSDMVQDMQVHASPGAGGLRDVPTAVEPLQVRRSERCCHNCRWYL